jgi:hypothetical protein
MSAENGSTFEFWVNFRNFKLAYPRRGKLDKPAPDKPQGALSGNRVKSRKRAFDSNIVIRFYERIN